ncbi:MAG: hypothetical protein ACFFDK_02965 [Promethearchaeota archaeon]
MEKEYETQFFIDVLEKFSQINENSEKILLLICKKIIELMILLDENKNKDFVQNALIVIIALLEDYIPDFPMRKGRDLKEISKQEQETLNSILKQEISI